MFQRFILFLLTFTSGSIFTTGLVLRLEWGNWGRNEGAQVLFVLGILSILVNFIIVMFDFDDIP